MVAAFPMEHGADLGLSKIHSFLRFSNCKFQNLSEVSASKGLDLVTSWISCVAPLGLFISPPGDSSGYSKLLFLAWCSFVTSHASGDWGTLPWRGAFLRAWITAVVITTEEGFCGRKSSHIFLNLTSDEADMVFFSIISSLRPTVGSHDANLARRGNFPSVFSSYWTFSCDPNRLFRLRYRTDPSVGWIARGFLIRKSSSTAFLKRRSL